MVIKNIIWQTNNDFKANYECVCGNVVKRYGYSDANFYNNVIPNWKCPSCGKSERDVEQENKLI